MDIEKIEKTFNDLLKKLEKTEIDKNKLVEMADELVKVVQYRRYEYRYGLYIGRFQPLHKGHCSVIRKALSECEKLVIVIGSTQEVGTRKNPFSFEDRKRFIEKVFEKDIDRIIIIGLEDRPNIANDSSWGEYVFNKVNQILDIKPEAVYAGEELINSHWYDTIDIVVKKVNRGDINVSATEVREALYQNDYNKVKAYLPSELMEYYEFMKERIQTCYR